MALIWATRGRHWGFRFLRNGGLADPLPTYEQAFARAGSGPQLCHRIGERVVIRFPDPEGRMDRARRVIPHDFIVSGETAEGIHSLDDARRLIWPEVAPVFERVWELPDAPPVDASE